MNRTRKTTRMLLAVSLAGHAGVALADAQPIGATPGVVIQTPSAGVTHITAPDGAIIDYAAFNVGRGETVNFIQPGASSRVLNRVHSATPSQIDGTINANGIVYIVNPSGVIFGPGSVVDAAGIYAAAGSLSNEDFLSGVDRFSGLDGPVTTHGVIRADSIAAFIGREVVNTGTVEVPHGTVVMASGDSVLIGSPLGGLMVQLDVTPRTGEGGVANDGTVNAGRLSLETGDLYALAIAGGGPGTSFRTIEDADTDADNDIDNDDINTALDNFTGPQAPGTAGKFQEDGDTSEDADVDDADLGTLIALYTGPLNPPGPPTPSVADDFELSELLPPIGTVVNLTEADLGVLRDQLGITVRTPAAAERLQKAQARALYNDLNPAGETSANPDGSYTVVSTRLDADVVRQALSVYQQRLAMEGVEPAERSAMIKSAVKETLRGYNEQTAGGEAFNAERFVAYVSQANAGLLDDLGALEALRELTLTMGLSEREKMNSDKVIVQRVQPEGLTYEQMKATLASAASLSRASEAQTPEEG